MVSINVGSAAGGCSVGSPSFYRYVLRLTETGVPLTAAERRSVEPLGVVPHAYDDESALVGVGWRVVPAESAEDWSVLEVTPQRLRSALETARRVLWNNAAPAGITADQIIDVDTEIENVLTVLQAAEDAGCSVNVSYVS
jgi:hypothetical protein